jgi:hypothetical protein
MDVSLASVVPCLLRADHSYRGVLPTVMCMGPIEEIRGGDLCPLGLPSHERRNTLDILVLLTWVQ